MSCDAAAVEAIHADILTVARGAARRAFELDPDDPRGIASMAIYAELFARSVVPPHVMEELKKHTLEFIAEIEREQSSSGTTS